MKLNIQKILSFFKTSEIQASSILKDKRKASATLKKAFGKAVSNKSELEGVWSKLVLLFGISKDYINGDYTEVPKRTVIAIVGALIYFLSPIDVIPDFIPVLGLVDDVFVLNLVYKQVIKDLEKYKIWKDAKLLKVRI